MYLTFYNTVHITTGVLRAIIFDTQKNNHEFIPPEIAVALNRLRGKDYGTFLTQHYPDDTDIIKEYVAHLQEKSFLFFCKSLAEYKRFGNKQIFIPPPGALSYLLLDIGKIIAIDLNSLCRQVIDLRIPYLQFRFSSDSTPENMLHILTTLTVLNTSAVHEISIIAPWNMDAVNTISASVLTYKYLTVTLYNAPKNTSAAYFNNVSLTCTTALIDIPHGCGVIKPENFILDESFFLESLHHNTCLNRKIAIDQYGEIKNCPSMQKNYGNFNRVTLQQVLDNEAFTACWKTHKSQIDTCRVCEFRNICTDCRAYIQDKPQHYGKPSKCRYNPYTAQWQE